MSNFPWYQPFVADGPHIIVGNAKADLQRLFENGLRGARDGTGQWLTVEFYCRNEFPNGQLVQFGAMSHHAFEQSENRSYRKGTFWLEGNAYAFGTVFALLVLNLDKLRRNEDPLVSIKFSPVPLGPNGNPPLPKDLFLEVALAAFHVDKWSKDGTAEWVKAHISDWVFETLGKRLSDDVVERSVADLEKIRVVEQVDWHLYHTVMTAERFEEAFGVKLPEVPRQN